MKSFLSRYIFHHTHSKHFVFAKCPAERVRKAIVYLERFETNEHVEDKQKVQRPFEEFILSTTVIPFIIFLFGETA